MDGLALALMLLGVSTVIRDALRITKLLIKYLTGKPRSGD